VTNSHHFASTILSNWSNYTFGVRNITLGYKKNAFTNWGIEFDVLGHGRGLTKDRNRRDFAQSSNFLIDRKSAPVPLYLQTAGSAGLICPI